MRSFYEILKEYYVKHFYELLAGMQHIAECYQEDPEAFVDWFMRPVVEEKLPKTKPGRTSSAMLLERKHEIHREMTLMNMGRFLWSAFATGTVLTVEAVHQYAEELGFHDADPQGFATLEKYFRRDLWENIIRGVTEICCIPSLSSQCHWWY